MPPILAGAGGDMPPQPQHRLPETRQCPAVTWGAAPPPLGEQQFRNEPGQFPRHIKRGTIGDHVGPPVEADFVVRPLLLGSTPTSGQPGPSAVCPDVLGSAGPLAWAMLPGQQLGNAVAITVMVSPAGRGEVSREGPGAV